jgi:hypothetical protein
MMPGDDGPCQCVVDDHHGILALFENDARTLIFGDPQSELLHMPSKLFSIELSSRVA